MAIGDATFAINEPKESVRFFSQSFNVLGHLKAAFIPGVLYAIQNVCIQNGQLYLLLLALYFLTIRINNHATRLVVVFSLDPLLLIVL